MKPLEGMLTERIYIFLRGREMCKGEAPVIAQSCKPGLPAARHCRPVLKGQVIGTVYRVIATHLGKQAGLSAFAGHQVRGGV